MSELIRYVPPAPGVIALAPRKTPTVSRLWNDPLLGPIFRKIVIECYNRLTMGGTFDVDGKRIGGEDNPDGIYLHDDVLKQLGLTSIWHADIIEERRVFYYVAMALRLPQFLGPKFKVLPVQKSIKDKWARDRLGRFILNKFGRRRPVWLDYKLRPERYLAGVGRATKAIGAVHPGYAQGALLGAKRQNSENKANGWLAQQVQHRMEEAEVMSGKKAGGVRVLRLPPAS